MIARKKKLLFTQLLLLVVGVIIIFFTYFFEKKSPSKKGFNQKVIDKEILDENSKTDIFLNIEYSGLDLSGNRYVLRAEEATNAGASPEIVNLKGVVSYFYFKDDTVLSLNSQKGIYNNKTLNMVFEGNVEAKYQESKLFAEKAEYNNSESFLIVSKNVVVKDLKGTISADELFFDIKKQKLNISSLNNSKINANVDIK